MKVICPICKISWELNRSGFPWWYEPKPTKLGKCTCSKCYKKSIQQHIIPLSVLSGRGIDAEWRKSTIREFDE